MTSLQIQSEKKGPGSSARPSTLGNDRATDARRINGEGKMRDNSRVVYDRKIQPSRGDNRSSVGRIRARERLTSDDVAKALAEVLQTKYSRLRSPAKEMANDTGVNERACRNHIAGLNSMHLAEFFNACRSGNCPELTEWGLEMMGAVQRGDQARVGELLQGHRAITLRIEADGLKIEGGNR